MLTRILVITLFPLIKLAKKLKVFWVPVKRGHFRKFPLIKLAKKLKVIIAGIICFVATGFPLIKLAKKLKETGSSIQDCL